MSVAWVGAGIATVGAISANVGANKARNSAEAQSRSALEFEQNKLDDWNEVYGPVQDNLSDYYTNLTPEYYETIGLENFAQEQQTAMTRLDESLAQRGLDPASGISASLRSQSELDAAEGRASIRRDAPRQVAEDKSRFLQIGLGQNPGSSLSNELSSQARSATQRATSSEQAAGTAISSAVSTAGTALVDYYNKPAEPVTTGTYDNAPAGPPQ
tara:strand:+ start:10022 stop:10663 length:642 start_codon:yes stop_codon:yes gene_type:complete